MSLRKWTSEFIEENGGNGGQEIRNWLVLLGLFKVLNPNIACYEPIPEWVTGMAIVQFAQSFNKDKKKIQLNYEVRFNHILFK